VERLHGLIGLPYALAGVLVALGWLLLLRGSELWELLDRMLCTWLVAAGTVLAASTALALAEAGSLRERRLAGALVYVSAASIGLALALSLGVGSSLPVGPRRTVAVTLALMLGAFGYALALHGSLDTPRFVRWLTSHAVYSGLVASATWALVWAGQSRWGWPAIDIDPPIFLSLVFASLLALDALRRLAWRLSGDWVTPWAPRLERARVEFLRGPAGRGDPDQWMDILVGAIAEALAARRATGFLPLESGGLRLGAVRGARFDAELARSAEALLGDLAHDVTSPSLVVLREIVGQQRPDVSALRRAGVSLVCALPGRERHRGLLLIGGIRSEHDLSSAHLALVEQLTRHAALEIEKADLGQDLLLAQARIAGIGYAAAGLAHDLGRPLGEIFLETQQTRSPDKRLIGQLAGECIEVLERVLEEGKTGQRLPSGVVPLALVLEAAAGRIGGRHGGRQAVLRFSPQLPPVEDSRDLQRVIEELLENAMRWSASEQPVELIATAENGIVTVRVVDHGSGMSEADLRRAFEPFFSTRSSTGLGLVVCQDIVRRLGGSLHLASSLGDGTTAILQIPRAR
jgi:signal transduction histidine kinase